WLFYDYQQNKEHLLDHAMATASTVSLLTDKHFSNVSGTLHALATSPSLSAGDLEAFYRQAQDVLPSQDVANIALTDRHGMQVFNTLRPFGEALVENRSSIRTRHFGDGYRPLISDIFYGPVAGSHVIAVAVPVRRQGEVIYSLSTGMSPAPFTRVLAQAQLPPSWIAAILDSQGNFVARSRDNERFTGQAASPALRAAITQEEEGVLDGLALHPTT